MSWMRWEDNSVNKMLSMHTRGHKFRPQNPRKKSGIPRCGRRVPISEDIMHFRHREQMALIWN